MRSGLNASAQGLGWKFQPCVIRIPSWCFCWYNDGMGMSMARTQPVTTVLNSRYRLLSLLGAGEMGAVYRAHDRLTGETVALKRVANPLGQTAVEVRLALAREFQSLAALRHPNIVTVRDYGFDEHEQPFFTMDLLPNPRTLVDYGQLQSITERVRLLAPVLHGLAYLHRRQIVHRDLKPGNVLVAGGEVKLLDFGLAGAIGQLNALPGTLLYAAPELLSGAAITPAVDFFSFGVLAFELLAGWRPFGDRPREATAAILAREPDWEYLDLPVALVDVLRTLLVKDPANRFADANAVLDALGAAVGLVLPQETIATRESFLQAAPLIGRDAELQQLRATLDPRQNPQGAAWLVQGESGVGKSRLLNEVRTLALVDGMMVLRGQAVAEGGGAYHLWRELLRWLVLLVEVDVDEAAVLHTIMPDLPALLERPLPIAPPLDPEFAQFRLHTTIAKLLARAAAQRPLLCLLEDLHWADTNSLALMTWLLRQSPSDEAGVAPLFLIGSYRREEAPQLVKMLVGISLLPLTRLAPNHLAELGEAMLGAGGRRPDLIAWLQRETEGNTFFVVEVLRALAEEAGQLDRVGDMALPAQIMAGSVQQMLQRRLRHIPRRFARLMAWAAVAGRQLDLVVLATLVPPPVLEEWLTIAANALVVEIQDGRWQFHHDKLRAAILADLTPARHQRLHRDVGLAIERRYADEIPLHAANLAYHFQQANDAVRERRYSRLAGEVAAGQFANQIALTYFTRALDLTPPYAIYEQIELLLARERVNDLLGARPEQWADLQTLQTIAQSANYPITQLLNHPDFPTIICLRLANYAETTGAYPAALTWAQEAIALADAAGRAPLAAEGRLIWGRVCWRQGELQVAVAQLEMAHETAQASDDLARQAECLRSLGVVLGDLGRQAESAARYGEAYHLFQQLGDRRGEGRILNNLAVRAYHQSKYAEAKSLYEQAMTIYQAIGDRHNEGAVLNNLGLVADCLGDYGASLTYYQKALALYRQIENRKHEGAALSNLGSISDALGDYPTAQAYFEQSLHLRRELGDRQGEADALISLGLLYHHRGEDATALAYVNEGLALAEAVSYPVDISQAHTVRGHVLAGLRKYTEAKDSYERAFALRREIGEVNLALEPLAGLARVAQATGDLAAALGYVEEIVAHLQRDSLEGAYEPVRVYLTCWEILAAVGDPRAVEALTMGVQFLLARAERIPDPPLRESYLHNVATHRQLLERYENL
jgi:tetratricopeptide (TPR) repeat protein